MPTVSFQAPTDYTAEAADLERRRKYAELLQQQSMEPLQAPQTPAGGFAVPISPLAGLAKMLQAYGGRKGQEAATAEQKALAQRSQDDLMRTFAQSEAARAGNPALPANEMDTSGTPAQPGNDSLAAMLLMRHPTSAPMGMQMYQADVARKRLAGLLRGDQGPQGQQPATGVPGGAQTQGGVAPQQNGSVPAGVDPLAWKLAVDKGDEGALSKLLQEAYVEQNKPQIDRGFGIKKWDPVTKKYVLASNPADITTVKQAELSATQPYEPPITLKTSSGQEIQLSRPEWVDYQKTKVLPQRITGPIPQGIPQSEAGPYSQVNSATTLGLPASVTVPQAPGLGSVGVSQSQEDQVRQRQATAVAEKMGQGLGEMGHTIFLNGAKSAMNLPQLQEMERAVSTFTPGKLTGIKETLGRWAVGTGLMTEDEANKKFGNIGSMQELQSISTRMASVQLRQSDGNPAVKQLELMLESMPNKGQTPEGFALTMKYMQAAEHMNIAKMQEAHKWFSQTGKETDVSGFESAWAKRVPQLQQEIYGSLPKVAGPTPVGPAPSDAPAIAEGATATGPGGQKIVFRNGQWVPK